MATAEEDDLWLLRASAGLVDGVNSLLARLLWKPPARDTKKSKVHRVVKERELDRLILLIEPFQEDPQLLDSQLKNIIPQLVTAYLESLKNQSPKSTKSGQATVRHAISRILYTFCKVRGEKIIVGFLNNEPRYVEPLLVVFEQGTETDDEATNISWEERFILLIWLSHLMLAPFDLSTMSSFEPNKSADQFKNLEIPAELPGIPLRVIPICFRYLEAATKERTAAVQLLVRLCLRPDMRKVGLLDSVAEWALSFFANTIDAANIHRSLGILSVLSGILASGNQQEIGHFIAPIFKVSQDLMTVQKLAIVRSSAVARKLNVKILRNVVVHCLKVAPDDVDTTEVLEEVIGLLLELLADGDTPVRYAASKALSVLTLQLDPAMSSDVIEAILGSLTEDVLWQGSSRNLAAVNPLRWHGLTLTLGHLLYRRAIPTQQLPEILNALLLALTFEQRSATGSSVGTNVRDAANFGIWSISRRYTTKELLAVETSSIRAARDIDHKLSIPQLLAIELIESACLDPAGNIRRGSSAALQELIGRHPDTIVEGIPLVQIVDFHAVGLRQRAMTEVAISAAGSNSIYWESLFHALLGWRGIAAVDPPSRVGAATAVGLLSATQPSDRVLEMIKIVRGELIQLSPRQVEERHGLVMALASIISVTQQNFHLELSTPPAKVVKRTPSDMVKLSELWSVFDTELFLKETDFTSQMLRPELTTSAVLVLIKSLSLASQHLQNNHEYDSHKRSWAREIKLLDLCLARSEDSVLEQIPGAVKNFSTIIPGKEKQKMVNTWLSVLSPGSRAGSTRSAGRALALGAIYYNNSDSTNRTRILDCLTSRCAYEGGIEERVNAVRSLALIIQDTYTTGSKILHEEALDLVAGAVLTALNDYTINERGDVGSLVRLEALKLVENAWHVNILSPSQVDIVNDNDATNPQAQPASLIEGIRAAVARMSLEKLDKVRMRAAACWDLDHLVKCESRNILDVSSYQYFSSSLSTCVKVPAYLRNAILEGFMSSAGMGSESIVQVSRSALETFLNGLDTGESQPPHQYSLLTVGNTLMNMMRDNLNNDRAMLPLLEVIAFLLEVDILQRLTATNFKWRTFLSLIQKSHYKSSNIQKLILAVDVYRGLSDIELIRDDVLVKLTSMLLHPFPKIRTAAAETLFVIKGYQELKSHDWTMPTKSLKDVVEKIKQASVNT